MSCFVHPGPFIFGNVAKIVAYIFFGIRKVDENRQGKGVTP